jgi:hypothetical protein
MTPSGHGSTTVPSVTRAIADIVAKSRLNLLIGNIVSTAGDAFLSQWLAVKRDGIAPSKNGSDSIGIDMQTRKRVSKAVYMDWICASSDEVVRHSAS